jgi:hypothetical protein
MTTSADKKALFRSITVRSGKLNVPIIVTNHTYLDINTYGNPQKIAGGSGMEYNPSVNIILSKAKIRDESKDSNNLSHTGITVTSKLEKSRFTKPIPIKFQISFITGMNKYVYLEEYVDWETCGIQKGTYKKKVVTEKILDENGVPVMRAGKERTREVETDELEFQPDENSRTWAVKHLERSIKPKELFNKVVFTEEVLRKLDAKMSKIFLLPEGNYNDELDAINQELNRQFGHEGYLDDEDDGEDFDL